MVSGSLNDKACKFFHARQRMLGAVLIHAKRAGDVHVKAAYGAKLGYYHSVVQNLRSGLVSAFVLKQAIQGKQPGR